MLPEEKEKERSDEYEYEYDTFTSAAKLASAATTALYALPAVALSTRVPAAAFGPQRGVLVGLAGAVAAAHHALEARGPGKGVLALRRLDECCAAAAVAAEVLLVRTCAARAAGGVLVAACFALQRSEPLVGPLGQARQSLAHAAWHCASAGVGLGLAVRYPGSPRAWAVARRRLPRLRPR